MSTLALVILIAAIVIAALLAGYALQQRSRRLRSRYGPEYDEAIREYGNRSKAEAALIARQERMKKLHVHSLSNAEREQFAERWQGVQSEFVDDPAKAIHDADALVCEAMQARGYPMTEFERRAEDLSVDHPLVVRNYRAAHEIALRLEEKRTSTEDLRQALVYYRELFDDLLEAHGTGLRR
jgi:hypothetical protein